MSESSLVLGPSWSLVPGPCSLSDPDPGRGTKDGPGTQNEAPGTRTGRFAYYTNTKNAVVSTLSGLALALGTCLGNDVSMTGQKKGRTSIEARP